MACALPSLDADPAGLYHGFVNSSTGLLRKIPHLAAAATLAIGLGGVPMDILADGVSTNAAFSIRQHGETTWLVRPSGERFFSFGVNCVNQGASRQEFEPANPGYAAWQHYADSN